MELLVAYSNQTEVRLFTSKFATALQSPPRKTTPDQAKPKPKQKQTRLRPHQVQQLTIRYQAGETLRQLSAAFDISTNTASNILKREGIPTRHRKLTDQEVQTSIKLYQSGRSQADIAARCNVQPSAINHLFKRRGVRSRPVGTNRWG